MRCAPRVGTALQTNMMPAARRWAQKAGWIRSTSPVLRNCLYLDGAAWDAALSPRRVIRLQAAPAAPGPGVLDAGGRMGRSFAPERQSGANVFDALAAHIAARRKAGAVVLASHSEGARERLRGLLEDHGAGAAEDIATLRDMQAKPNGLYLTIWPLEAGF